MQQHEKQRQADKLHHESRVTWLNEKQPKWSCGTPVAKHDAAEMLNKSIDALRLINDHGMTTNSASNQDA